ncbi:uncharacterized protein LOC123986627 isoform X2 [Micropterus dolomieu]|uniref:uncharacterized protein LOC123986627 isoform X1 n=1 Tax=Micropterus dolomieu TaxID=147949 RepID=UPI001E8E06A1|nr:uncharacterized protein LOC123986627 isoform X1 [Micropterus dolomieu]XP_045930943.1 uncharacterized protein LOC123986627 isoform X2 [Micropterus dolomieu]XP_045930944.1 uncharacterized protein LOC123986627 isoform X2 [Micropterus dolomieu]XP_045930945.1 uncharacterized protein LOC123986627 isoform X2 [Micropterus dolomieu]XP_045930946.1 uncharacterized protein LOC123986627 isoform X2 [Micropterus dolomieu]
MKHKDQHPFNNDIKNGNAKEAATKEAATNEATDFNHGEVNASTGNLSNTADTCPGQGPTQLITCQMEPSNGNEAMLTRMLQAPAVDAPQNRKQIIHKTVSSSQDAEPVKHIPNLASAVRVTEQHTSPAQPKDKKTCTPKPMLQRATPAKPSTGPYCGGKVTAGKFDALRSDILQQFQDVPEKVSQQQSRHSAPVQQQKKTTAPVQQQENKKVMYGHTQPEESRNLNQSQQRLAVKETTEVPLQTVRTVALCDPSMRATADSVQEVNRALCSTTSRRVECSFGSKKQQEMNPQLIASEMQAPLHTYRAVVKDVTTENLHNKSQSQKLNCVNEASNDFTCHATNKANSIAERSTTIPGTAEMPVAELTEPPDHAAQMLNQSIAHIKNEENVQCLNQNSVTDIVTVDYQYCLRVKSEITRANTTKMRLRLKLAKKLKAQTREDHKSSQQTADDTVTTVQESSQQQGYATMGKTKIKKRNEPQQIPQPNKADSNTNGNTSSHTQKVNVKALAPATPKAPLVERKPTTAPNNAATHNPSVKLRLQRELKVSLPSDTAVKPKKQCTFKALNQNQPYNTRNDPMKANRNGQVKNEILEQGITPAVPPVHKVHTEGRWYPFTVNRVCPHKVDCLHNPGTDFPQNIRK